VGISTLHAALLVIVVKLSAPVMVYRQERKRWALKLVKMQPKKAKDYLQQRIGNALNAEMLTGLGGRLVTVVDGYTNILLMTMTLYNYNIVVPDYNLAYNTVLLFLVCNAPKVGDLEERTGLGGGFNERGKVEYNSHDSDNDEYDDFGRKKKKFRSAGKYTVNKMINAKRHNV